MKSLRKPYISIFLASLILFVSCSQENINTIDSMELSELVSMHLNMTSELPLSHADNPIMQTNNNTDIYHLGNIHDLIQNMGLSDNQKAKENVINMISNISTFLNSNPELIELGDEGVMNLISTEIDIQLETENISYEIDVQLETENISYLARDSWSCKEL